MVNLPLFSLLTNFIQEVIEYGNSVLWRAAQFAAGKVDAIDH